MSFTPAQSVYHKDTFSSIIKFLPWKDLIQCYSYDCTASDLVLPEIRRRISALVSLFIPTKDVLEFFEILRDSDGLICGSAARYVLLPYNPAANDGPLPNAMPLPNDLNVLVAHDRAELFFQFFAGLEYEYSIERADTLYASHVTKVEVFTKTRVGQKDARITLSLCKNNVLSTLLRSPTTSEMNAITFDAVYSLYPRLTYANEGLILGRITQENVEVDRLRAGGGVKLFRVNEHWTKPCGWYCPMRIRKTYDDPGVARYRWSMTSNDLAVYNEWGNSIVENPPRAAISDGDLLYSCMESWTIFDRCLNTHCPDAAKYNLRSLYLKK